MSDTKLDRILFYYSGWQPSYVEYGTEIEFRESLPKSSDYSNDHRFKFAAVDVLMRDASNDTVADLFTKGSHHKNLSVPFVTLNLFHQSHGHRDILLNANYIVIFRNSRDRAQI